MSGRALVTRGILAGGQATRLGGADKALLQFRGNSLLERTLAAFGTGHGQVLVSYNGNSAAMDGPGLRVLPDLRAGHPGPLAGIEALLAESDSEYLLVLPVDLRDIPPGMSEALLQTIQQRSPGQGLVVRDGDGLQPLVALWPVSTARIAVKAALDAGELSVQRLQRSLEFSIHDLSPWRLGNLNSPEDFE